MNDWRCVCGVTSKDDKMMCWHCGEEREFCMSASQARAVARELNRLEQQRDDATVLFRAANQMALKPHQKMSCGHEARFTVTGKDTDIGEPRGTTEWCALCLLEAHEEAVSSRIKRDLWLDENRAGRSIEEATDEAE